MKSKSDYLIKITALLILLFLSCGKTDQKITSILDPAEEQWLKAHSDELYFAPDPFYAPFEFYDEKDGKTKGLAHEYIKIIEKKLGIKFKIIKVSSFDQILTLAKEGKVSIVNAATKTPERSEFLLFTEPIVDIKNVILVRKDSASNLSLKDLSGKRVSLVKGYAVTDFIEKNYPAIECDIVSSDLNAILNVSYRISDAAIIDLATASYLTDKEGISNIQVAGDAGYPIRLAIGSRKDWPELNSILTKGLAAISPEEREEIHHKWISIKTISFIQSREFKVSLVLILLLVAVSGLILLWNKQLKKQILLRTSNLEQALDDLRISETSLRESDIHLRNKNESLALLNEELNATIEEMEATNEEMTATYQALLESEERIHSISNNIQSGMIYQAVINKDGSRRFTYLSDSVKILYGITPEEGMADPSLIYRMVSEEDSARLAVEEEAAIKSLSTFKTEIRMKSASGGMRWSSFVSIPRLLKNGLICFDGIEFDITEQKNALERINILLKEKELLLQEVHHRIKNNMNTIKGLLALQITAEENPSAAASLRDAESRVQSMIMLYDRLYCTENYREMSVKDYLQSLAEEIIRSFPNRGIMKIETDIEDFILNVNILTPLGIIVNELITNMMKYAFPGKDRGVLIISAAIKNSHVKIVVQDDGVGIPESVGFNNSSGFGLDLVGMLVEQLGGIIIIERGAGTKFVLEFDV